VFYLERAVNDGEVHLGNEVIGTFEFHPRVHRRDPQLCELAPVSGIQLRMQPAGPNLKGIQFTRLQNIGLVEVPAVNVFQNGEHKGLF
jgi:hypothetical protein